MMNTKVFGSVLALLSAGFIASCSTAPTPSDYYQRATPAGHAVASSKAVIYSSSSNIVIYNMEEIPTKPFKEISTIQVDLYNEYGIKRQQATINQMLKEEAWSAGGNGLIIIDNPTDRRHCYAKVVQISK